MNLLYGKSNLLNLRQWADSSCIPQAMQLKLVSKLLLLLFLLVAIGPKAWAQPTEVIKIADEDDNNCQGIVKFKFIAGTTPGDYNIDNTKLMIQFDGETAAHELMYFDSGDCNDQIFSLPLADVTTSGLFQATIRLDGCERQRPYGVKLKNAKVNHEGGNRVIQMELHNLGKIRAQKGFKIWLDYKWWKNDEDLIRDENSEPAIYKKFEPISAVITRAARDECNPTEIAITAIVNTKCIANGFAYAITIEESTDPNFNSFTTLERDFPYYSHQIQDKTINHTYIKKNAGTEQLYYRAKVSYKDNSSQEIFQTKTSSVGTAQSFDVAAPHLISVSEDVCDNEIQVKWEYNTGEADKFALYRSNTANTGLHLDGVNDAIDVQNSTSLLFASELTLEADIKLEDLSLTNIFFQTGGVDIYTDTDGKLDITMGDGKLITDPLPLNTWVHITIVYNASSTSNDYIKVFYDGDEVGKLDNISLDPINGGG
ncbi:MAG: LamG-like jellyroll fold domain-containing protein, partial [Saprospiraceae bacterium]